MARCPECDTPGAYIGFNSVECRNPQCQHFKLEETATCPCCGGQPHPPLREYQKAILKDLKRMTNPCAEVVLPLFAGKTVARLLAKDQKVVVITPEMIKKHGKGIVSEIIEKESPCIIVFEDIDRMEIKEIYREMRKCKSFLQT